jgi:hypothetical protein
MHSWSRTGLQRCVHFPTQTRPFLMRNTRQSNNELRVTTQPGHANMFVGPVLIYLSLLMECGVT